MSTSEFGRFMTITSRAYSFHDVYHKRRIHGTPQCQCGLAKALRALDGPSDAIDLQRDGYGAVDWVGTHQDGKDK